MNIRSISNPALVLGKDKVDAAKTIKSDETDEREGNGQQPQADGEPYRSLTDEELDQVIEKLKAHEGIRKNGLLVTANKENNQNIIRLETPEGKVIKRFVERDLYFFLQTKTADDIQLVSKTA